MKACLRHSGAPLALRYGRPIPVASRAASRISPHRIAFKPWRAAYVFPPVHSWHKRHKPDTATRSMSNSEDTDAERENQERITNLGAVTDELRELVPTLLQTSLPKRLLSEEILLRICPSHFEQINSYLPNIKGHVSYYATCKAAQILLTSLVLNPHTRLHIESIRTSHFPDAHCVYSHSSKIFIRWSTCPEGCDHLFSSLSGGSDGGDGSSGTNKHSTANAKFGSHRWSGIDAGQILHHSMAKWSISSSIADIGKGIVGLRKEESKLERIISGVFIFELNEKNDKIIVHTIEDMNIVERRQEQDVGDKLRVC